MSSLSSFLKEAFLLWDFSVNLSTYSRISKDDHYLLPRPLGLKNFPIPSTVYSDQSCLHTWFHHYVSWQVFLPSICIFPSHFHLIQSKSFRFSCFNKFVLFVRWTYLIIGGEVIYIHLFFPSIWRKCVNMNLTFEERTKNGYSRTYVNIFVVLRYTQSFILVSFYPGSSHIGNRNAKPANIIIITYWFQSPQEFIVL